MENKYYIPSIEEFHVGFEYEELEMGSKEKFNKTILDEWDGLSGYIDGTTDLYEIARGRKKVRVKYLDKEDIESLGFEVYDKYEDHFIKDNTVIHYRNEAGELYPIDIFIGKQSYMFMRIKNKSELKILLKQLNIK